LVGRARRIDVNPWVCDRISDWHAELQGIDEDLVDGRGNAVGARRTDGSTSRRLSSISPSPLFSHRPVPSGISPEP
jgi:hypothetical protein